MQTYDPRLVAGDARRARPLPLSWSALWGGGLIGWGTLFVLSLAGASIGLANVDATSTSSAGVVGDRLAHVGVGVGLFGLISMLIAAFVGGFFVVRIAGEQRRREGLLHAAVSWGLSAVALAVVTFSALGTTAAAEQPTAARTGTFVANRARARENIKGDTSPSRLTPREQVAIEDTASNAAKTAGATAGALALSLGFSLFGGLLACAFLSGRKLKDELKFEHHGRNRQTDLEREQELRAQASRDNFRNPTIIPPTH